MSNRRTWSEAQQGYFLAKARLDEAEAELGRRMAPYAQMLDSDEGIDAYCDLEAGQRMELDMLQIEAALRQAEAGLIDWAFEAVEQDPKSAAVFAAHGQDLHHLRQTRNVMVRRQLVEVALRLAC